jgi:hypothetical protein
MPRNGGTAQNGPFEEAKDNLIHGQGVSTSLNHLSVPASSPAPHSPWPWILFLTWTSQNSDKLERTEKVADLPEGKDEKGLAIEGMNASGGQSAGIKKGDNVGQGN